LSEHISDEPYLLVEEVAERLGLPLSVLLHRVEAGDIPARRVERADGLHYALRLGDLGIELDDRGLRSAAIQDEAQTTEEETLSTAFEPSEPSGPTEPSVESAIFSAFDSGPAPVPGRQNGATGVSGPTAEEEADALPWQPDADRSPPWSVRPREPQQPPVWLTQESGDVSQTSDEAAADVVEDAEVAPSAEVDHVDTVVVAMEEDDQYLPPALDHDADDAEDGMPAIAPSGLHEDDLGADQDTAVAELAVPPPTREPTVSLVDAAAPGPRGDLASMSLDARELVAGLLDRWERTLEQRIYTEQRQRFQAELVARQNMVKQLQMELHTARAEHAAAQAEKDRILAGKERELADRERDIAETRRAADEAERAAAPAASRRRRWFWSRDD